MRRPGHYMSLSLIITGARYATCSAPGCMHVRRAWDKKPLIHNGGKP